MGQKKVMVLSYWPINDVLTQAAILPHIQLLQQVENISEIVLVTIEREESFKGKTGGFYKSPGVKHFVLRSRNYKSNLLNKVADFLAFPKQLLHVVRCEKVDVILASGTPAGALALKVWKVNRTPFYVLYEPHSTYMLENKIWHRFDPRYICQQKWEREQLKAADGLIVVSENYRTLLLSNFSVLSSSKVLLGRNPVIINLFKYGELNRHQVRTQLSIPEEAIVGIYTGKYGGLYYNNEAFEIYRKCFELIPNFFLIILSPGDKAAVSRKLSEQNIGFNKVYLSSVQHREVSQFLAAADFAFATIKSYPSARFCSPIKIGEYWANGLPVLLTEGVGDDSDIIRREGGGALFNLKEKGSLERAILEIQDILGDRNHRQVIPELAKKYRSPDKLKEAYTYFFGNGALER